MKTGDRVSIIGTRKTGEVISEAPRSSFSQKRLFAVKFDGNPRIYYFTENELRVIVEPAREVELS